MSSFYFAASLKAADYFGTSRFVKDAIGLLSQDFSGCGALFFRARYAARFSSHSIFCIVSGDSGLPA
jgi:hypothetical protein